MVIRNRGPALFPRVYVELVAISTWGAQHPNFITVTHGFSFYKLFDRIVAVIWHHLLIDADISFKGAKLHPCFIQSIYYGLQLEHSIFHICFIGSNVTIVHKVKLWFQFFEMLSWHRFLNYRAANFISFLPVVPLVFPYIEATQDKEANKFPDLIWRCCESIAIRLICLSICFRCSQFNNFKGKHFFEHLNHW